MKRITRILFISIVAIIQQFVVGNEAFGQVCNLIGNNGSDQITNSACAPVQLTMPVNFAFLAPIDPTRLSIRYEWGYGSATTTIPSGSITYNAALNRYEATATHTYPPTTNNVCSYTATAYVVYDGVACAGTRQRQTFAFWNTDDRNSGQLAIDPNPYRVCEGTSWSVNFRDVSSFNCRVAVEPDRPNQLTRWVQFVYGPNVNGNKIPNVSVTLPDGTVIPLTNAAGNVVGNHAGPIVEIPALALGPNQTSYTVSAPAGGVAGNFFEITLRNWNICNPYRTPAGVLTGNAPRETTARVVIVPRPNANVKTSKNSSASGEPEVTRFCPGDRIFFRTTTTWPTGSAASHILEFYDGPNTTHTRFFRRTSNSATFTTDYTLPANIEPGIKTVVIESFDRNANNSSGVSGCRSTLVKHIEVVAAPVARIVNSVGSRNIEYCKNDPNDVFPISFTDDPDLLDPSNTVFRWRFIDEARNIDSLVGPSYGASLPTFSNVPYREPGGYKVIFYTEDMVTRCGTSDTVTIKIHGRPTADFEIEEQEVYCENNRIVFNDLSQDMFSVSRLPEDRIVRRRWYFDYDNNPGVYTDFNEGDEVTHTYTTSGTYRVRLEVTTGYAGCSDSNEREIVIDVFPSPETNFTAPPPACAGTFTFINNSHNNQPPSITGPVSYYWIIYEMDVDSVFHFVEERIGNDATFDYVFTNDRPDDKTYRVRLKAVADNQCSITSEPQDVIVNPGHVARFSSNYDPTETNCGNIPNNIYFEVDNATRALDVSHYVWEIRDPNGIVQTINLPTSDYILNNSHYNNSFQNSTNSVRRFTVTMHVVLNTPGICISPFQQPIMVSPVPDSDFELGIASENCDDVYINFNALAKGLTYNWTVTPESHPSYNPVRNDNFRLLFKRPEAHESDLTIEVVLETINATHCRETSDPQYITIPRKTDIPVELALTSIDNGCHVFTADFSNITPSGYPAGTTFDLLVQRGASAPVVKAVTSGSISGNFSYEFEEAGTYQVYLRATAPAPDRCEFVSDPIEVTVHPAVSAGFTPNAEEGCSVLTVDFTDNSTNPAHIQSVQYFVTDLQTNTLLNDPIFAPGQLYTQTFPANNSTITHEYKVLQLVTSTMGCTDRDSTVIRVFPAPSVNFEVLGTPICYPFEVDFRNNSLATNPPGTTYIWYWGDGTFSEMDEDDEPVISHIYSHNSFTSPRNLNVMLLAKTPDGCEILSDPLPITINPRVQARIVADNTVGCAPLDVNFNNFSRGHNTSRWYKRRVGDANFVEFSTNNITTLHTFHNLSGVDEEYEVMYVAYSNTGCRDTAMVNITVFADLEASFEADPAYQLLPNRTVEITRPSSNIPDTWDFYWEFGDGFTSTQPNPAPHTYANYGTYEITLTVSGNNCTARHTEVIVIDAIPPVVDFEYDPERGCSPLRVNFTDRSLWTDVSTYLWDFGDGIGFSNAQNPSYTYSEPGFYTVSLTASNAAVDQPVTERKEFIIQVLDNPRAIFQIRPSIVYLPGKPVYTANASVNAVSYLWDFGDGHTTTEFEPTHIYTEKGIYDISLTVTNADGCTNTLVLRQAVRVEDGAELRIPNAFTPSSLGPGGNGGSGINDVFLPITEGVSEFNMMIFNRWGELLFESRSLDNGWDGYYKGKLCKQDVYVYKIQVKFMDGETATRIGDVTLLR